MDTNNLNYVEKWAARDEEGRYRDIIVISDNEPTIMMGRWDWRDNNNFWSLGPNQCNISIRPGEKKKIKVFMIPAE